MNALKLVLMLAGVLLLATAAGIPLYGMWLRIRIVLKRPKGDANQGG